MGRPDLIHLPDSRILIYANGSHAIGLGHVFRMRSLACVLRDLGSRVAFLTMVDESANKLFKDTGLPCYCFHPDSFERVRQQTLQDYKPDLIIQDVLDISQADMRILRRLFTGRVINFDDTEAGLQLADVVVNGMVFHWGRYSPGESVARLYEGPKYMILNPAINRYVQSDKVIVNVASHLLLAFGGTDTYFLTERVLRVLNLLSGHLTVTINMGPGTKYTDGLEQALKSSHHNVRILYSSPDLLKELFQADVVICSGGTMLYELAAMGVPSICIPAELHEVHNANYWSGMGTTMALSWEKNLNDYEVISAVEHLLPDHKKRLEMSLAGRLNMDSSGLDRVIKIVEETLT